MKIKLTPSEATALILRALNLPDDTEVSISRQSLPKDINDCLKEIDQMHYNYDEKIPAIKRLRNTFLCGLLEAKWAIEHWNLFKNWVQNHRRWPKFEAEGGSFNMK